MEKNREMEKEELPFGSKDNTITILNALFRYGHQDRSFNLFPGMSTKEYQSKMESVLKMTETTIKNKPSLVDWLCSDLFEENECNVALALLFIAMYEQHPPPDQEDMECDFSELYNFLHKMTTNQPVSFLLSRDSANVLHKLLSELIEEVWPSMQPELLDYLSKIHVYSRSTVRRTYSRKRMITAENCS